MAKLMTTVVEQVVVTKVPGYTLTLTNAEAMALLAICGSILGSSTHSPRKYTDAIYAALVIADVDAEYQSLSRHEITFANFNTKGNSNGQ
jgi:hypothetical protein